MQKENKNGGKIIRWIGLATTICVCMGAYIAGMIGKGQISDLLLAITLLLTEGTLVYLVFGGDKEDRQQILLLKQVTVVVGAVMFLTVSAFVYKGSALLTQWIVVAVVAAVAAAMVLCVIGLKIRKVSFVQGTGKVLRENTDGFVVCAIFTVFSATEMVSISQWDASFYINSLENFAATYDLTFKTILSTCMGGHLSAGYSLIGGAWHMLMNQGNIGVKLGNLFLGWLTILCICRILRRCMVPRFLQFSGSLLVAVSPMFLGTIGFVSVDFAMMVYFLIFLCCYLEKKYVLMMLSSILFLFTKETALVIYFFFWLGVVLYRLFTARFEGKIRVKDMVRQISANEWRVIGIPTALFLISFFVCAVQGIGWPGSVLSGKQIPLKLVVAAVVAVVMLLIIFYLWIVWWHQAKRCAVKKGGGYRYPLFVAILPVLLVFGGLVAAKLFAPSLIRPIMIYSNKDINRFGISKSHLIAILKQSYVLNFSWILVILLVAGMILFVKNFFEYTDRERELIVSALFADLGLVFFTIVYVTYRNPRYLQLHYLLMMLMLTLLWRRIFANLKGKKAWVLRGASMVLVLLMFIESFCYLDPLTRKVFYNRDIGNGVLCSGDTKKLDGIASSYSDRAVSNRVYSYYFKNIEKFLKDIEFDGSQKIIFPKYNNWILMGRKDLTTLDKELKCMVSYEGSIADAVIIIEDVEELEVYQMMYDEVYYIDTGALHTKIDQAVAESMEAYGTYETGTWKTTAYQVSK